MLSVTRNLAAQWVTEGVRVNAIVPGVAAMRMTAPMDFVPEVKQAQIAHIPIGRFAEPAEIASTIAFLCSEGASYCTGSALVVDGGYSVH